ncbi:MAG: hypothetical protein GSR84_04475 [Desulfurococcales archaeon]|nr:hypothetical protein [Desulfurococcales archaeon]
MIRLDSGLFTSEELELLESIREEEIKGMSNGFYGCKPTKYSSVKIMRQTIEEEGFQSFILIGGKGHGKSTYSLKSVAFYMMYYEGLDCAEAYLEALDRLAFSGEELMDTIEKYGDIVIWDDAGLHGSTYLWFIEGAQEYVVALSNWFDVARTDLSILIMSTPTKKKLPPVIRTDPEALLVRVRKNGVKQVGGFSVRTSLAQAVRNLEPLYTDRIIREEVYRDYFTVYLPTPVYRYYKIIRDKYSAVARRSYRRALAKARERGAIPLYEEY